MSVVEPTVAAGDQENPEVPILENLKKFDDKDRLRNFKQIKIDFPIETI